MQFRPVYIMVQIFSNKELSLRPGSSGVNKLEKVHKIYIPC